MTSLFHMVPDKIIGDKLMPLNQLKQTYPEIYEKEIKKYIGRENILKQKVIPLNCLWNDVLHFTAVHPLKIKRELEKIGFKRKIREWFVIDPSKLNPKLTSVYLYKEPGKMDENQFTKFSEEEILNYSEIPNKTREYYEEMYKLGQQPLLFHLVPHILYKNSINFKDMEKIKI